MNLINISCNKATIEVEETVSDNQKYRYELRRIWDKTKKKALVIGINPSTATYLKGDNTITNAMNYCIDNGYGTMIFVNLFAFKSKDPKGLTKRNKLFEIMNDTYITEACKEVNTIILAWGYDKKKYKKRKKQITSVIKGYKNKAKCFMTKNGQKPCHLRTISTDWQLVKYFD